MNPPQSSSPTALRRLFDWCLPPEARADRRWIGWLLFAALLLIALFLLFSLVLLIVLIDSLATHGTGSLGGQSDGSGNFRHGVSVARWWLFGLLSVAPLSLFRLWWHFGRSDRPAGVHGDLKAAQDGDGAAAHRLGQHYRLRDPSSARAWLARAAHAGVPEAMVELALDLREGRGGPKDLASAQGWLRRARAAGAPGAKEYLKEVEAQLGDRHSDLGF